jgi:ankyrin repeat protein
MQLTSPNLNLPLSEIPALSTLVDKMQALFFVKSDKIDHACLSTFAFLAKNHPNLILNKINSPEISNLHTAVLNNQIEIVKTFAQEQPQLVIEHKLLQHAVINGKEEMLAMLLSTLSQQLNKTAAQLLTECQNEQDQNLLHIAAQCGHANIVTLLLATAPTLATQTDIHGYTPHYYAMKPQYRNIADDILTLVSGTNSFPKHCELASDAYPVPETFEQVIALIINGVTQMIITPGLSQITDEDGWNLLHYAVYKGNIDLALSLIKQYPELAFTKTEDGENILQLAAQNDQPSTLEAFYALPELAVFVTQIDSRGWNLLHHIVCKGNTDFALRLIKQHPELALAKTNTGQNILKFAYSLNQLATLEAFYALPELAALVTQSNSHGWNLLHSVVCKGDTDFALRLIKEHPELALAKTNTGQNILKLAYDRNQLATLAELKKLPELAELINLI